MKRTLILPLPADSLVQVHLAEGFPVVGEEVRFTRLCEGMYVIHYITGRGLDDLTNLHNDHIKQVPPALPHHVGHASEHRGHTQAAR